MELPIWFRYKREKDGVLMYSLRTRSFYFSQSKILYLLLKNISKGHSLNHIIVSIAKDYNLPLYKIKKKFIHYYTQLKNLIYKESCNNGYNYNPLTNGNGDFDSPLAISLLLTYRCNLKCRHCLVGSLRFSKIEEIDTSVIKNLAEQMEKHEVFKVILNGGEPTVRKDFLNILKIFRFYNIPIELVTNGLDLTRERVELMNDNNVVIYNLSLEGKDSATHDFIRGEGNFRNVCESLGNLKKYSKAFEINVEVTYSKHNLSQIQEIVKLMDEFGVTSVKFARLKPWNWGTSLRELVPSKQEIMKVNEEIWKLRTKYHRITISGDIPHGSDMGHKFGCNVNVGLEIQPDGNVIPCRIFEQNKSNKMVLGNIMNESIIEIWNSQKAKNIRNAAKKLNSTFLCKRCSFYCFCPTNYCIAENYIAYKELLPSESAIKCGKI
ncbi:MAG: radical SAM protein [bacterium]